MVVTANAKTLPDDKIAGRYFINLLDVDIHNFCSIWTVMKPLNKQLEGCIISTGQDFDTSITKIKGVAADIQFYCSLTCRSAKEYSLYTTRNPGPDTLFRHTRLPHYLTCYLSPGGIVLDDGVTPDRTHFASIQSDHKGPSLRATDFLHCNKDSPFYPIEAAGGHDTYRQNRIDVPGNRESPWKLRSMVPANHIALGYAQYHLVCRGRANAFAT